MLPMAWFPRFFLAGLLLGQVIPSLAVEEEKKPGDDSIMVSRKELEALKTDHLLSPQQKATLSSELDAPSPPTFMTQRALPNFRRKPKEDPAPQAKPGGWLVDAMERDAERESRDSAKSGRSGELDLRGRTKMDRERASLAPAGNGHRTVELPITGARRQNDSLGPKSGAKAPNPLNGYMATWMTSGDFALLQKPAAATGGMFREAPAGFADQTSVSPSGSLTTFGRTATASASSGAGEARRIPAGAQENPYLQILPGSTPAAHGPLHGATERQLLESLPAAARSSPRCFRPRRSPPGRVHCSRII